MSDLTLAVSEAGVNDIVSTLLDPSVARVQAAPRYDPGAFTVEADIDAHFEHGPTLIDFRDTPDQVKLDELDIVWDTFDLDFELDIPELCIGGFCLTPGWFGDCIRAPEKCFFSSDPDVELTLALDWIRSEVSVLADLLVGYSTNRTTDYLQAQVDEHEALEALEAAGESGPIDPPLVNTWDVSLHPDTFDIDIFDTADMIADIVQDLLDRIIDMLVGVLPDWAIDVLESLAGSLVRFLRNALDIGDDLAEWLSDIIGVSLDVPGIILEILDDYLIDYPVFRIEDPYPVLDWSPPLGSPTTGGDPRLIPVKVPIEELDIDLQETEVVLTASIGAYQ